MEAARTLNMPAMLVAIALFAFCAATVVFQQTALSKTAGVREDEDRQIASGATFPLTGEADVAAVVSACQVELDNGSVEFQVADSGLGRVTWEVVGNRRANAEQLELQVSEEEGVLVIKDEWHGSRRSNRPDIRLQVWLPITTDLDVALGNGNLTSALDGKLNAALGNGEVELAGAHSALEVALGNGHVHGTARLNKGENAVHLGNGAIKLKLLPGSDAHVRANTATGQVQIEGLPGKVVNHDWVGSSYEGEIGAGAASVVLQVGHGDVQIESAGS